MRAGPKRVVITGASSGIGQATALLFAGEGAQLALAARGAAALDAVAVQCHQAGAIALAIPTDVTDAQAVKALADRALTELGGIDLWFSNVGVGAIGLFHEVPIEAQARIVAANLVGHMNDAHAVLPIFLAQGFGTFVNMISLGGFAAMPYASAYSASKFGLRGFSEALRAELAEHRNIHVCDIYPAFVDTPALSHAANYVGKKVTAPPPLLDPRSVAEAVVRLAEHPRETTTLGVSSVGVRIGHFLSPALSARAMRAGLERYFETAEEVPRTDGNLFAPPTDPGGIDGGMRSPIQDKPGRRTAPAVVLIVAAGIAALMLRRRKPQPAERKEPED